MIKWNYMLVWLYYCTIKLFDNCCVFSNKMMILELSLDISVTNDIVTTFDRKHPLFLLESTSYVDVENFILVPDLDTLKIIKRVLLKM